MTIQVISPENLDLLIKTNNKANKGRGCRTVTYIIQYLERGDLGSAYELYRIDGDKIPQYEELYKVIKNVLGCRTHGIRNCPYWPCDIKGKPLGHT